MNLTLHKPSRRLLSASALLAIGCCTAAALAQAPQSAPSQQGPVIQAHAIANASPKGVTAKLREIYSGRPDIRLTDTPENIVVEGPPAVQAEVAHWLAAEGLLPPQVSPAAALERIPANLPPQAIVTRSWPLAHLTARDFEARLISAWGPRLQTSQDSVGDVATFRFPPTPAGATSVVVDRRTNTATVASPKSAAPSWERLMSVLDSRPQSADEQTTVVPIARADKAALQKAATLLKQAFTAATQPHRKRHVGQFVTLLFGQEAAAQPAQPTPPPPPAVPGADTTQAIPSAGGPSAASMEAIARINNVQIEILDDVVVVRGRKEDVDRVLQIIEQIEQQSILFRPEIEVFYLKNVDSTAMSEMITQVYSAAFARQGLVTIVPLQRPNALLLIGRKENIPSIVELITKLDLPAPTDGEFRIFRLQNMSSIDAERTLRSFFVTRPPTVQDLRPGLGTRALIIADYRTNSLLVQAAPRDMLEIAKLLESLDTPDSSIAYEVRVFKLRNAIAATLGPILEEAITAAQASITSQTVTGNAGQATAARATPPASILQFLRIGPDGQELIRSGIMANMRISADAASNTLIVVGPAQNMGLMEALIERLDQLPASEAQIKVFTIRNGDATALAEMLQNLFGVPAAGAQGAVPGQGTATGAGESAIVPLRFSVDQRTNSIIASGNAGDLSVIFAILTKLDEGDIRQRELKVYRLRNAPAQDVSNALTQMLAQQVALVQSAPELVTPVEQIEQQVIVVPEVVTNSLIISATANQMQRINTILETLDRRPPMVIIQAVLAEVTLTDNEAFGIEWGLQDALMFDRSSSATGNRFNFNSNPLSLPNDPTAASLATAGNVAMQGVSNLALGRTDLTQGFGGLVLTASNESVSVLLRALERSQRSQIISRPQVQTMDNQTAFVQVGAKVPRIIGATNTGLTVTPIINDINVGIIMQVTPRVSPDGAIVMQIYTEKSTVGPDATGIPIAVDANGNAIRSPQIPITTAQTIVLARTGQTVILGGLITNDLEEDTRRVPYLADIPVLGRLFRYDQVLKKRTELLIILTPYLVTSPEQIDWINAREGQRMSWCLADLVNIHGPVPMGGNPAMNLTTPLIYPDIDPSGYPSGPDPYGEVPSFPPPTPPAPGTGLLPTPAPANLPPPAIPPYGAPPGPFLPGPLPQSTAPAAPNLPPPPPSPGLGTSRRSPDGALVPELPSLIHPGPASSRGTLAPPQIEPAAPPVGTARNAMPPRPYLPLPTPPEQTQPLIPATAIAPAQFTAPQQASAYQGGPYQGGTP